MGSNGRALCGRPTIVGAGTETLCFSASSVMIGRLPDIVGNTANHGYFAQNLHFDIMEKKQFFVMVSVIDT